MAPAFIHAELQDKYYPHKKPPPIPWEGLVVRPGMYRVGVSEEGIPDQLQGLDALWRDNGDAGPN